MHKLTRTSPEPPALISARSKQLSKWDDFPSQERKSVRNELLLMQDFRCAYCERQLHDMSDKNDDKWDGHIEHFRRKDGHFFPELVFVWDNLFYSCLTGDTCGKCKDRFIKNKEQCALLIDPCKDNPEDFLIFTDQGRVEVCSGLSSHDQQRAEFTIKAFGLNAPKLVQERIDSLRKYRWLKNYPKAQWSAYLSSFVVKEPFITSIFHFFGRRVVKHEHTVATTG